MNQATLSPSKEETTAQKLHLWKWVKITSKIVFWLGVVLEIVGLLFMILYSYSAASGWYISGLVLLSLGTIGYLVSRIYITTTWVKKKNEIPAEKKTKKKKGMIIHLSLDVIGILVLVLGVYYGKNALGDVGSILFNATTSFFNGDNSKAEAAAKKSGGFMKGICHASSLEDATVAKGANVEWTRLDLSMVEGYNSTTKEIIPGASYTSFKANLVKLKAAGLNLFLITPYPADYAEKNINPQTDYEAIKAVAHFYFEDLKGIAGAFQIANELMEERFTYNNMTFEEKAKFIGLQLEEMDKLATSYEQIGDTAGNILLGYNVADMNAPSFIEKMKPYHQYCDYIGVDMYVGCFESLLHDIWANEMMLRYAHQMSGLPVVECEFGYIGLGKDKSTEERTAFIQERYPGFTDEADCRSRAVALINSENFTESLRNKVVSYAQQKYNDTSITLTTITNEQAAGALFDTELKNHFYCIMDSSYYMTNYPHTREGQAAAFRDLIPQIAALPFCIGGFVYHLNESKECYLCGQSDCPNECGWGLYNPYTKEYYPAYTAVKEAFAAIKR